MGTKNCKNQTVEDCKVFVVDVVVSQWEVIDQLFEYRSNRICFHQDFVAARWSGYNSRICFLEENPWPFVERFNNNDKLRPIS